MTHRLLASTIALLLGTSLITSHVIAQSEAIETPPPSQVAAGSAVVVLARYGQSVRGTVDGFPLLVLRGTHAQRGEAHGALTAKQIIAVCGSTADFLLKSSYAANRQDNPWEKGIEAIARFTYPQRFEQELAGMLRGIQTALPDPADRVIPSLGRQITLEDLKLLQTGEVFELMRCSQFSAWGALTDDGQPIVGRNWDYPPLYSMDYACIVAIEPAEPGLSPTFDAMCFGMISSGMATINRDGVYASANDGGISEQGVVIEQPEPVGLLLRTVMETAAPDQVVDRFVEAIDGHVTLGLLFQFVGTDIEDGPAAIVEYDPQPDGQGTQVRHVQSRLPYALLMTNHCVAGDEKGPDESVGRYRTISDAINRHGRDRSKIRFDEVRQITNSVAKASAVNTTMYTAVAWPAQRKMMVATAPDLATPATQGRYVMVEWDQIFAAR